MRRLPLTLTLLALALAGACDARSQLGVASGTSASGTGASSSSGATGGGGSSVSSTSGTGGSAPSPLCPDDPCTAAGCAPVRLFAFNPFDEGGLVAEAPFVCLASNAEGSTEYDCFDRCGGAPFMTAVDKGYPSGLLLEGGALTSAVGVSSVPSFVHVVRRDLHASSPATPTPLWSSDVPFQLDNLARSGGSLYFSWTAVDTIQQLGIYRMPYAGGTPVRISDWRVEPEPHMMAVSGGVAYLSSDDPAHYGIASFALDALEMPTLLYAEKPPVSVVAGIAVSGERIVWADVEVGNGSNESWIRSMALDGSGPAVLADVMTYVMGMVADAGAIYVSTQNEPGMGLSWIPLGGGTLESVVTGESRVDLVTQDADYLFYVGHDGVYRVRKPKG